MRAVSTLTAIGTALLLAASSAFGLGFGRVTNATQLGQPLNFAASVRLEADESLARECVSAEVQSGDNRLVPGQIRATLEGFEGGERSVRVTTSTIIDEPVVTVSVTLGCTAKITRKFVAFIDPPLVNLPDSQTASAALPPQRNDSQVAPLVTLVEGEKPAPAPSAAMPRPPPAERPPVQRPRPRAQVAPRPMASDETLEPAPPRAASRPAAPRRSAAGSRPAPSVAGPRLKLETAPAVAATAASAAASAPLNVAAAPSALPVAPPPASAAASAVPVAPVAGDASELLAKERERMRVLEEGLAKLRSDAQATQAALLTMQARLKEAESARYANPLVYGLAWLAALLALAVVGLLWRQARARNSAQWWVAPAPAPAAAAAAAAAGAASTIAEPRRTGPTSIAGALAAEPHPMDNPVTGAGAFGVPTVIEEDDPSPATQGPLTMPPSFTPTAPMPMSLSAAEPVRELSVEELIDLEQQAEFFIVLGQDEAAIELLMSHVRTDGGISPLPYLKLLEIYRRRGESDAYERIRDRFNRRFNAYAPDWDSDLQHGRTLTDYPDTILRLQGLWATPTRVMETLDASLFRRNKSDETFDLPAYRELLFLYSIARDLAEHGGSAPLASVDLLLPLNDDPDVEPISRLLATAAPEEEFQNSDMMTMPLDLDVSFGPAPDQPYEHAETLPAALRRTPDQPPPADSGFIDFDLDELSKPPKK